ncbi:putative domain HDIG-containing protein [Marinitoga piezophila KA3]|uniref:Putative domain HDIG-containing protein n=1 Tax=Marinitoga piezophila (strain DSM 14283 / JCM 11233 / KA3) TaxID=443254 RepID=H2J7X2_MARPK|nr:HD domain-containing phosphohydrolase [Marinitoga piezophila]AEX85463.1 putative domain HDIG-containing protein [Marinitoga piezophila KA3]
MKRLLLYIFLLINLISFGLTIGIYHNPPKIIDKETGIFPELIDYILTQNNVKHNYEMDTFSNLLKKLNNGEIDAIACIAYSAERAKHFYFNKESFISDWAVVYTNHNSNIHNMFDLKNKKIGVLKGDIFYEDKEKGLKELLKNFDIDVSYVEFNTYEDIFKALSKSQIDAGVVNRAFGLTNAEKYNLSPTDIIFFPVKVMIAFRKDYPEKEYIANLIDTELKKLKEDTDSKYYEVINKYLYVQDEPVVPRWLKIFILFSMLIIVFLIINHLVLLKLVERRTMLLRKLNLELQKKNEELQSLNEEISSQNEELEELYLHNEKLQNSLKLIIKAISDLGREEYTSEDNYLKELFKILDFVFPGIVHGRILKIENDEEKTIFEKGLQINNINKNEVYSLDIPINLNINLSYIITLYFKKDEINTESLDELIESFKILATTFFKIKNEADIEERFREDIIKSLISFLELHDEYTKNHSKNVAELSKKIAEKMGFGKPFIKKIYWAGLLHDIGKLLIPIEILNKKSRLTEEEYEYIKKHPEYGYNALIKSESLSEIAIAIRHHHERWDGKGYPDGLKGEAIPIMSQIISVADAWDAMRSRRSYRNPLDIEIAIKEIEENAGKQFSPEIVKVFIQLWKEGEI